MESVPDERPPPPNPPPPKKKGPHTYVNYIRKQLTEYFVFEVESQALG